MVAPSSCTSRRTCWPPHLPAVTRSAGVRTVLAALFSFTFTFESPMFPFAPVLARTFASTRAAFFAGSPDPPHEPPCAATVTSSSTQINTDCVCFILNMAAFSQIRRNCSAVATDTGQSSSGAKNETNKCKLNDSREWEKSDMAERGETTSKNSWLSINTCLISGIIRALLLHSTFTTLGEFVKPHLQLAARFNV